MTSKANSQIGNFVKIGSDTTIGKGCTFNNFAKTGKNVYIGDQVEVNEFASIA